MSWRVAFVSVLLCGEALSRPSLLGAAPGSSLHHGHGDHHVHGHEDHHSEGHEDHHNHGNHHEVNQNLDYSYEYNLPEQSRTQDTDDYYDENPDKSYSFQFAGDAYSRDEAAESDGSVKGSYSYTDGDGVQRTVNYRAGAGIGFEVIDPEVDQMFASFGQKMKTVSSLQPSSSTKDTAISQPDSLYGAPPLPAYGNQDTQSYQPEPIPSASVNSVQSASMMMDPSYYFEYKSADSERSEDADSSGVVVGKYKYKTAGGNDIEVRYRAGADTGFVVENLDELNAALENAAAEPPLLVKTASEIDSAIIEVPTPLSGGPPAPQVDSLYSAPAEEPGTLYGAPEEQPETLYEALAEELDTLYGAPAEQPDTLYGAPAPIPSYEAELVPAPSVISSKTVPASMMMMDPSYNFAYTGENSEREENADSNGIVQGQYSYTNAEGNEIVVKYKAGADIGFVVENEEELNDAVKKATDDGAVAAAAARITEQNEASASETSNSYTIPTASPLPIAAPDALYGAPAAPVSDIALPLPSYNEPSQPDTLYGAPSESVPISDQPPPMVMDASFNFSVDASDHSFQEEADQAGERTGSYSYINPEGESIEVRYRAGRDGFVILNADQVLPRAPVV